MHTSDVPQGWVMNGYCGTNDAGKNASGTVGVDPTNLTSCDQNALSGEHSPGGGSGGGGCNWTMDEYQYDEYDDGCCDQYEVIDYR